MKTATACRRRFTLTELLVAIGVLAVLVTMLLPVLFRARQSMQRTACASNLRQLGMAMHLYWDDYEQLPTSFFAGSFDRILPMEMPAPTYEQLRDNYNFDYERLRCPAAKLEAVVCTDQQSLLRYQNLTYPNYAGIGTVVRGDEQNSERVIAADLVCRRGGSWETAVIWRGGTINHLAKDGMPTGGNFLGADNHVEWKAREFLELDVPDFSESDNSYYW